MRGQCVETSNCNRRAPRSSKRKRGLNIQVVFTEKVHGFGEDGFTCEHWRSYLLHDRHGPRVIRIVAIEIGDERTSIANGGQHRLNLRRVLVAARRRPARAPARSDVSAKTDSLALSGRASTRSRTSAATLLPASPAWCLSRRRVASGSLIVIPFMPIQLR